VAERETLRTMGEAKCVIAGAEYSARETLNEGMSESITAKTRSFRNNSI
jgi:hypothetical protein